MDKYIKKKKKKTQFVKVAMIQLANKSIESIRLDFPRGDPTCTGAYNQNEERIKYH